MRLNPELEPRQYIAQVVVDIIRIKLLLLIVVLLEETKISSFLSEKVETSASCAARLIPHGYASNNMSSKGGPHGSCSSNHSGSVKCVVF